MAAETSKKDAWDKADIVAKGLAAIVVSGVIAFYTIFVQEENRLQLSQNQEENRKVQTLIQLINSREASDSNMRGKMFDTLLNNYFNKGDPESQIVALEMIGLNFRNTLQIKPMFNQLDRQLVKDSNADPDNKTHGELRALLRKAARTIIRDQLNQIEIANGGNICKLKLNVATDRKPKFADCFSNHAFKLVGSSSDSVRIQAYKAPEIDLSLTDQKVIEEQNKWKEQGASFGVTYFDMPMTDYTQLPDGSLYYSLVLLNSKDGEAEVAVAVLPPADYSSGKAYQFDQLVDEWIREPYSKNEED